MRDIAEVTTRQNTGGSIPTPAHSFPSTKGKQKSRLLGIIFLFKLQVPRYVSEI